MFLVNTNRKWHPSVNMLDVESVLMFYMYDLTVEEVGVLALAFFKTRTRVLNVNLVELMYKKLENRVDDVDQFTLTAYLKVCILYLHQFLMLINTMVLPYFFQFFRLCTDQQLEHRMKQLLDKLTTRIDDLPLQCCLHVALLGSRQLVFHQPTLQKVCERFYDNMASARLKVIRRHSRYFTFI